MEHKNNSIGCTVDSCKYHAQNANYCTKNAIEVRLRKLGRSCNIEGVFPHRFRSTCATSLMRRGMPLQDVSSILGHSQLETTKIYLAINDIDIKQSYQKYSM